MAAAVAAAAAAAQVILLREDHIAFRSEVEVAGLQGL